MRQSAILNISHGLINKQTNILYHYHKSLFDILFKEFDLNIFNYDGLRSYYYDIFISNNFLNHHHSTGEYSRNNHLKELLLFHSSPPPSFKKEDIQLVHQNTMHTHSIFFGEQLASSWKRINSKYTHIIEYGLPDLSITTDRTKNIILFNFDNNQNVNMLHQYINKNIGNCDMLQDIPGNVSINDIGELLSQYNICIDTSSFINVLLAASFGCCCITPLEWENNSLITSISDYNNIVPIIDQLLKSNLSEDVRQNKAKELKSKYSYNLFQEKMLKTINIIKNQEIFWI